MSLAYEDFIKLPPEKQEEYDFRKEILELKSLDDPDDPAARHMLYQATGIKKGELGKEEADELLKGRNVFVKAGHADNCTLIREIWTELWTEKRTVYLGGKKKGIVEEKKYMKECKKDDSLCLDTMNSVNTTLDKLFEYKYHKDFPENLKRKLNNPERLNWSIKAIVWLYAHGDTAYPGEKDAFYKPLRSYPDVQRFLKAAYTIGNFIPVPVNCNRLRAGRATTDYWDLALYCIYKWYHYEEFGISKRLALIDILGDKNDCIDKCEAWLKRFWKWDTFVEKTYMQPFVDCDKVRYSYDLPYENISKRKDWETYGRPKPFWKEHFDRFDRCKSQKSALPFHDKEVSDFFRNATAAIEERSRLIVRALREKTKPET